MASGGLGRGLPLGSLRWTIFFFLFPQWEAWSQAKYAAAIELACKSFRRAGIRTLTFAINRCIALSAYWELVIKLVRNIPGHI